MNGKARRPAVPADEELGAEPEHFLANVFWALSGGYRYLDIWRHPSQGNGYMEELVPGLRDVHLVKGAGHFVQMEAAEEVNAAMLTFLADLP